jgi:integrase
MRRTRYQQGNLQLAERKRGPRAWEYRWYESQPDGSRKRRSMVVGSLEQYPNEAAAKRAVASLLVTINAESPRFSLEAVSVQTLVAHYCEKELGKDSNKTFATCETYKGYFRKWILPRWGNYRVKDVKAVAVEEWLRPLVLSNGSKAKIRNIMHAVFNHAVRWEWHDRNPITHVRQSSKRMHIPVVLTLGQVEELLLHLEEPTRTAVLVDVMTGLRVGELLALKWEDIDFERFEIRVTRSISLQHVGECKTEASRKPVPLDSRLAEALWRWRTICAYPRQEDWVFASPHTKGVQPYWPSTLNRWHIQPAVKAARIEGRIGWHTFRRTYATLLKANGEDVKTVQELLRHANSLVTMNLYAQAITEVKRQAQSRLVGMLLDNNESDEKGTAVIGTKRTYEKIIQSRKLLN